jgi:DNA replication protein DnaC
MDDERDEKWWIKRMEKNKPSPEEFALRARELRIKKEAEFWEALRLIVDQQVGTEYRGEHEEEWISCWKDIRSHIVTLFETGKGACYSGGPGSGKTHVLLEYMIQICYREWEEYFTLRHDYPPVWEFIEKTVCFVYSVKLCESLRQGEKIKYAKYNLIDDLGVEATTPYVQSKLDEYFEEINRKGLNVVISTNLNRDDLSKVEIYRRIYSRLMAKCRFYELPVGDNRNPLAMLGAF